MAEAAFTRSAPKAPRLGALAALLLAATPAAAQVQVQTLAAPDLFSVGAGPSDLPGDLWQGSSSALARAVIPNLRPTALSPAALALARHILSAGANAPEGAGEDADLAAGRADALLQLGDAPVVEVIADHTPNLEQKTALSQVAAEAALIDGKEDKACGIGESLAEGRDMAFWLRLRAFCQARAGQAAPAQLTLDLVQQQSRSPDYDRLMAALLAGTDAGAAALDDGLDVALSRRVAIGGLVPALPTAAAPAAVAAARDAAATPPMRIEAAARAARLGFPTPDAYALTAPIPATVAAADQPGAAGEAALVALADTASDFSVKDEAIVALLRRAGGGAEFEALARLARPAIDQLLAAQAVLRRPGLIVQASVASGDLAAARTARAQVAKDVPALDIALLDALIAAGAGRFNGGAVEALDAAGLGADAAGRARTGDAIALLAALGAPVSPVARFNLAARELAPSRAPPARLMALDLAARSARMGDTALYALTIAAGAGAGGLAASDRAAVVRALDQAGLKADARAFAVEGLLALLTRP